MTDLSHNKIADFLGTPIYVSSTGTFSTDYKGHSWTAKNLKQLKQRMLDASRQSTVVVMRGIPAPTYVEQAKDLKFAAVTTTLVGIEMSAQRGTDGLVYKQADPSSPLNINGQFYAFDPIVQETIQNIKNDLNAAVRKAREDLAIATLRLVPLTPEQVQHAILTGAHLPPARDEDWQPPQDEVDAARERVLESPQDRLARRRAAYATTTAAIEEKASAA